MSTSSSSRQHHGSYSAMEVPGYDSHSGWIIRQRRTFPIVPNRKSHQIGKITHRFPIRTPCPFQLKTNSWLLFHRQPYLIFLKNTDGYPRASRSFRTASVAREPAGLPRQKRLSDGEPLHRALKSCGRIQRLRQRRAWVRNHRQRSRRSRSSRTGPAPGRYRLALQVSACSIRVAEPRSSVWARRARPIPLPRHSGRTARSWIFRSGRAWNVENPRKHTATPTGRPFRDGKEHPGSGMIPQAGHETIAHVRA